MGAGSRSADHAGRRFRRYPKDWDTEGIFYNKTYFAAHHIQIPANLTWNPVNGGSFLALARQATFDNPAGIAALQSLMNLSLKDQLAPPASEYGSNGAASTNQDVALFTAGKVAMDVEGDWFTQTIDTQAKFSFGVLPIPTGPDGRWSFTNGLIDAINVHSPNQTAAWELEQWLGSPASEKIMGSGGYVWPGIASIDSTFLDYWKAKDIDVSPFLAEAENSSNVETLPVAPQAGQVIVSLASDLGPAWLGDEPAAKAVATAAKDANQELQHPSP